jgi:hypothetical protein
MNYNKNYIGGIIMENITFFEVILQPKGNVFAFPIIMIIFVFIVMLVITWLMVGTIFTTKNTSISIKDGEVIINSFLYGRKILINNILTNEIKTINLKQDEEYRISAKTNGISLPNYKSGWMRLKNGKRALVFLTNEEKVLLMPTKDFIILFSMEKAEEFINKIKGIK